MTDIEFKNELSHGLSGGYLFLGNEDYLKRHYLFETRKRIVVDEAFSPFNHIRICGERYAGDNSEIVEAITMQPLMSDKKLIELYGFNFTSTKVAELSSLLDALAVLPDYPESVLILYTHTDTFDAGYANRPSALYKQLCKHLAPVSFEYGTVAKLAHWAQRHFAREGIAASDALCSALVEKSGKSMFILHGDICKLIAYIKAHERNELERADIGAVATLDTETEEFALSNALLSSNVDKALAALFEMQRKKVEPSFVFVSISKLYSELLLVKALLSEGLPSGVIASKLKIHEYKARLYAKAAATMSQDKLERTLSLCVDTDLAIKRSQGGYMALERLVCEAVQK